MEGCVHICVCPRDEKVEGRKLLSNIKRHAQTANVQVAWPQMRKRKQEGVIEEKLLGFLELYLSGEIACKEDASHD